MCEICWKKLILVIVLEVVVYQIYNGIQFKSNMLWLIFILSNRELCINNYFENWFYLNMPTNKSSLHLFPPSLLYPHLIGQSITYYNPLIKVLKFNRFYCECLDNIAQMEVQIYLVKVDTIVRSSNMNS
jgi:hypothetical protein